MSLGLSGRPHPRLVGQGVPRSAWIVPAVESSIQAP
jgi:hypothetical protein